MQFCFVIVLASTTKEIPKNIKIKIKTRTELIMLCTQSRPYNWAASSTRITRVYRVPSQHPTWTKKRGVDRRWGKGGEGWLADCNAFCFSVFSPPSLPHLYFWSASFMSTFPSHTAIASDSLSLPLSLDKKTQQPLTHFWCSMLT